MLVYNFNDSLGILHDWARKDRHRGLRVLGSYGVKANPKLRIPDETKLVRIEVNETGFIEESVEVATFELEGWSCRCSERRAAADTSELGGQTVVECR